MGFYWFIEPSWRQVVRMDVSYFRFYFRPLCAKILGIWVNIFAISCSAKWHLIKFCWAADLCSWNEFPQPRTATKKKTSQMTFQRHMMPSYKNKAGWMRVGKALFAVCTQSEGELVTLAVNKNQLQSLKLSQIAPTWNTFAIAQFIISTIKLIKQSVDVIKLVDWELFFCLRSFNLEHNAGNFQWESRLEDIKESLRNLARIQRSLKDYSSERQIKLSLRETTQRVVCGGLLRRFR